MPSPVGHALGGIAAGALIARRPRAAFLITCAAIGPLPDVDFLLPIAHRGPTHGIGAAVAVFGLALVFLGRRRDVEGPGRVSLAVAAAYASHILLDWLGADTWQPQGLMALWPFSTSYYVSGLDLFAEVNRRYWAPDFLSTNTIAVTRELLVLLPIVVLVVWWRRAGR